MEIQSEKLSMQIAVHSVNPKHRQQRKSPFTTSMTAKSIFLLLLLCTVEAWRPRPSLLKHRNPIVANDALRLRGGDAGSSSGPCIGIDLGACKNSCTSCAHLVRLTIAAYTSCVLDQINTSLINSHIK